MSLTVTIADVNNPLVVLIVGCVGLTLNIITAAFLHGQSVAESSKILTN